MADWNPWRLGLRYTVAQCAYSDAFGSGYRYAREDGRVVKFWTRKGAQAYADRLNSAALARVQGGAE